MIQRRSGVYIQQSNAAGGLCKKGIFAVFDVYEWSFQALRRCIAGVTVGSGLISYATAVGIMKSIVALVLLTFANKLSKKVRGESVF